MPNPTDTVLNIAAWVWSRLSFALTLLIVVAALPFILPIVYLCILVRDRLELEHDD
jgi:hypothetical protein